jgi:hypothetical protein
MKAHWIAATIAITLVFAWGSIAEAGGPTPTPTVDAAQPRSPLSSPLRTPSPSPLGTPAPIDGTDTGTTAVTTGQVDARCDTAPALTIIGLGCVLLLSLLLTGVGERDHETSTR